MADSVNILNAGTQGLKLNVGSTIYQQQQAKYDLNAQYLSNNPYSLIPGAMTTDLKGILYQAEVGIVPTSTIEIPPEESQHFTPVSPTDISVANSSPIVPSIRGAIDPNQNTDYMQKVDVEDPPDGLEIIPSNIKKNPGISMYMEMIDSDYNRKGIVLNQDYIVTTLKMSPNPESLTISSAKKTTRYTTMTRWVEEHWGDEIDTVAFNGSTFSFFGVGPDAPDVGLTYAWESSTAAYAHLKQLIKFFQVNGCLYHNGSDYDSEGYLAVTDFLNTNPDYVNNHPYKGMIKERMYIRLAYDYMVFLGRFESFDIIEDSKSAFRVSYNIIFKAEKTIYLLDQAPLSGASEPSGTLDSRLNLRYIAPTTDRLV